MFPLVWSNRNPKVVNTVRVIDRECNRRFSSLSDSSCKLLPTRSRLLRAAPDVLPPDVENLWGHVLRQTRTTAHARTQAHLRQKGKSVAGAVLRPRRRRLCRPHQRPNRVQARRDDKLSESKQPGRQRRPIESREISGAARRKASDVDCLGQGFRGETPLPELLTLKERLDKQPDGANEIDLQLMRPAQSRLPRRI